MLTYTTLLTRLNQSPSSLENVVLGNPRYVFHIMLSNSSQFAQWLAQPNNLALSLSSLNNVVLGNPRYVFYITLSMSLSGSPYSTTRPAQSLSLNNVVLGNPCYNFYITHSKMLSGSSNSTTHLAQSLSSLTNVVVGNPRYVFCIILSYSSQTALYLSSLDNVVL